MSDIQAEPIFVIDDGVSYEWCRFAVYPHPTSPGRYATFSADGCSCDWWEEPGQDPLAAQEPLERAAVRATMLGFIDSHSHYIKAGAAVRYLEQFETAMNEAEQA